MDFSKNSSRSMVFAVGGVILLSLSIYFLMNSRGQVSSGISMEEDDFLSEYADALAQDPAIAEISIRPVSVPDNFQFVSFSTMRNEATNSSLVNYLIRHEPIEGEPAALKATHQILVSVCRPGPEMETCQSGGGDAKWAFKVREVNVSGSTLNVAILAQPGGNQSLEQLKVETEIPEFLLDDRAWERIRD